MPAKKPVKAEPVATVAPVLEDDGDKIEVKVGKPVTKPEDPKPAEDDSIKVTVNKSSKPTSDPSVIVPPKIEPAPAVDDIPDDLLPTADELDLHEDKKSTKKIDAGEDLWAAELAEDLATDKLPKKSQPQAEQPVGIVTTATEDKAKVVKPEPDEKPEPVDDGKLLGYIQHHAKPDGDDSISSHPESQAARDHLRNPKVFDTKVIHTPISKTGSVATAAGSKTTQHSRFIIIVICLVVLAVLMYLALDMGMFGENIKVPVDLLK